jgi:hypothetical protein
MKKTWQMAGRNNKKDDNSNEPTMTVTAVSQWRLCLVWLNKNRNTRVTRSLAVSSNPATAAEKQVTWCNNAVPRKRKVALRR